MTDRAVVILCVLIIGGIGALWAAFPDTEKSDLRPRVGDEFQVRQGPILVTCECTEHAILVCTSRWSPERTSILDSYRDGPSPGIGLEPGLSVDWQGCRR